MAKIAILKTLKLKVPRRHNSLYRGSKAIIIPFDSILISLQVNSRRLVIQTTQFLGGGGRVSAAPNYFFDVEPELRETPFCLWIKWSRITAKSHFPFYISGDWVNPSQLTNNSLNTYCRRVYESVGLFSVKFILCTMPYSVCNQSYHWQHVLIAVFAPKQWVQSYADHMLTAETSIYAQSWESDNGHITFIIQYKFNSAQKFMTIYASTFCKKIIEIGVIFLMLIKLRRLILF